MADAAASGGIPTFKLVLVGDGGTGKVCILLGILSRSQVVFSMLWRRITKPSTTAIARMDI
jgi:GTPase SAR1 family protein